MNLSSLLGIFSALAVFIFSILSSSSSRIFIDPHAILIVVGGTAAAGLMCFPLRFYTRTAKVFIVKFLGNYQTRFETVIYEIVDLARGVRESPDYLNTKSKSLTIPFLTDAVQLIVLGGISEDAISAILLKRAKTQTKRYDSDVALFRTISKFPPAFGLLGTTLGMIALLQQLGSKNAYKMLGPAMAIGLVATFYGIILANLVFIPIAERLAAINREDEVIRDIVIDGMELIRKREHPKVVEEHLKSYLLPGERTKVKSSKK